MSQVAISPTEQNMVWAVKVLNRSGEFSGSGNERNITSDDVQARSEWRRYGRRRLFWYRSSEHGH